MASLRLTFPEKEEPSVIALTGARLTIGRLPFNTIQIIDRTVSGFHAELISEHGHYRLHDRGSSNGTFVNGQKIADYHLNEACTITFGTVEAQFSPEAVGAVEEVESFPTRSEINTVRKDNAELKATIEALREESAALRLSRPQESGGAALAVSKEEFDKVVTEREALKEQRLTLEHEINRLKTDLAVLKRDRVNLQLAYDGVQREITDLRAKAGGVEEIAMQPKAAAAALAAQISKPMEEIRVEVPAAKPAPTPLPAAESPTAPAKPPGSPMRPFAPLLKTPAAAAVAPLAPVETTVPAPVPAPSAPAVPASSDAPVAEPATAPAKLPAPTSLPSKPFSPLPKAPALAGASSVRPAADTPVTPAPSITPKAPPGLGSGIRPMAKPAMTEPASPANGTPSGPTPRLVPRPLPSMKLPSQPGAKLPAPAASGPKGTQKLS